jgi:hypothetical protein
LFSDRRNQVAQTLEDRADRALQPVIDLILCVFGALAEKALLLDRPDGRFLLVLTGVKKSFKTGQIDRVPSSMGTPPCGLKKRIGFFCDFWGKVLSRKFIEVTQDLNQGIDHF